MLKNIKLLLTEVAAFFRKDFNIAAYSYAITVIAASILLIYCTSLGCAISRNSIPTSNAVINNMLMFSVMYFMVALPVALIRGEFNSLSKTALFAKGIFLMCLIGFADAFSWDAVLNVKEFTMLEQSYIFKALWRMRNAIFVLPVFVAMRLLIDRNVKGLYGLCRGSHRIKAYLSVYVVILPVLIIASFTPEFLSYYPMHKPWLFEGVFGWPLWLSTVVFEIIYLCDFIMVEMVFRGMLVIGMEPILGQMAVLPMIAAYVALHFGKPALETISAIFGGYFVGSLAYQTHHIWGGIVIHMGIALVIELIRLFQHYVLLVG